MGLHHLYNHKNSITHDWRVWTADMKSGRSFSSTIPYPSMTQFLDTNNIPSTGFKIIPYVLYAFAYMCVSHAFSL
jgi:hypothetical protein